MRRDGPAAELDSALAQCRRKRIGPFAAAPPPADPLAARAARMKALGALARAGFGREVAEQALAMDPSEAAERLLALRQG
ncbi:hypothetical protein CKO45_25460 [Paracraurococcus ruber]|uniref:Regulatory protein RecX n=1 Tax=Paracraurococcus ruber TaxID=77675 RepID=A0ABS1D4T4_9PROT|nr:hypothetical protein [Paracraurococcus ruber]